MTVPGQFIKNLKVMCDKKTFSHDEIKIILFAVQEMSTLSPLEVINILDNVEILSEEATTEMSQADFDTLRAELVEE